MIGGLLSASLLCAYITYLQTLPGSTDGNNKDPELSAPQPLPATPFDFKRTEMVIKQAQAHLGGVSLQRDRKICKLYYRRSEK